MKRRFALRCLMAASAAGLLVVPSAAQAPGPLASLQPGLWSLRVIGGAARPEGRSICVRNAAQLLQVHHAGQRCTRRTLNSSREAITVRYECAGGNWGQTELRVETPRLAHIDTQGIAGGGPFHQVYEARRTGECG